MSKRKVEHYLLSIDLTPRPTHLHGYVMTADPRDTQKVANWMLDWAEKHYGPPMLPIILETRLNERADEVRRALAELDAKVAETIATSREFHISVWELRKDQPWDQALMALH